MIFPTRSPEFYSRSSEISFTVSVTLAVCILVLLFTLWSGANV